MVYNSGLRATVKMLDAEQQVAFKARHLQNMSQLKKDDGTWMDVNVIYTQARKIERLVSRVPGVKKMQGIVQSDFLGDLLRQTGQPL